MGSLKKCQLGPAVWSAIAHVYVYIYVTTIENRIYREEFKESLGMNFFSPFQP